MATTRAIMIEQAAKPWAEAARVFGIRVTAPFTLRAGDNAVECVAFLPHFGGPQGMVASLILPPDFECDPRVAECSEAAGLFYSFLNPECYALFDEETFKEALTDWGFFGPPEERPPWLDKAPA